MVFRQYTPTPTCLTIVRPDLPFRQLPGHLQRHDRQQMGGRYCAAGILAILSDMSTPEPELRWYQFTLRSLMLLTLFVAVICSLGVCTHWLVSAVIAMFALAGMAGRIVAGTRLGFVQGVVFGIQFLLAAVVIHLLLFPFLPFWVAPWLRLLLDEPWRLGVVLGIVVLIGGALGGLSVRPRSGQDR